MDNIHTDEEIAGFIQKWESGAGVIEFEGMDAESEKQLLNIDEDMYFQNTAAAEKEMFGLSDEDIDRYFETAEKVQGGIFN